jgi:hypothetical protein
MCFRWHHGWRGLRPFDDLTMDRAAPKRLRPPVHFFRWRILARIRRFLRPSFRRPFPVFFVPTRSSPGRRLFNRNANGMRAHCVACHSGPHAVGIAVKQAHAHYDTR